MRRFLAAGLLSLTLAFAGSAARADNPTFSLTIKDHQFSPAELTVPANTRVQLKIKNLDTTAAEFESKDFKAEKVIPPGKEVTVMIPALKPGTYGFFDEYHEATTKGRLIVQ